VEGNGTDIVVSGSWIALAFEDDAKVGNFRSWIGMIQRIIHRPPKGKPSLWTSSISLDDERIKDMFLNVAWLTPCNDISPRDALEYKWLPYSDAEEVCASYIINVPDVTYSPDTRQYSLCAQDLRRLNDYLDTILHGLLTKLGQYSHIIVYCTVPSELHFIVKLIPSFPCFVMQEFIRHSIYSTIR
jgi:hypothetical protein